MGNRVSVTLPGGLSESPPSREFSSHISPAFGLMKFLFVKVCAEYAQN